VVAGDRVGLDREAQQPEPVVEVVLPDGALPLEELLAAPDVVHEHVETALGVRDPVDQGADLRRVEVVGGYGDARTAGLAHQVGGVLDGLGAVVLRAPVPRAAPRHIDGGAGRPELHGDPSPGSSGRSGDQCDLALQRL
jgi:hypothetical protein